MSVEQDLRTLQKKRKIAHLSPEEKDTIFGAALDKAEMGKASIAELEQLEAELWTLAERKQRDAEFTRLFGHINIDAVTLPRPVDESQ